MVYLTDGTLGFVNESTYGIRIEENGAAATTATWALGDMIGPFPIPVEKPTFIDKGAFSSFDYGDLKSGAKLIEFEIQYLLMEGNCLYYALGTIAEGGVDDAYTHTITGLVPATGVELPSRTFHMQFESFTTDKLMDICGVVTKTLDLGWVAGEAGIKVKESYVAQRITDEGGDQALTGEVLTAAIDYSTAVSYMDSALIDGNDAYYVEYVKVNFAGAGDTDITGDIVSANLRIENEFIPRRSNSVGETNYAGKTINQYVGAWYLKKRRYLLTLNVYPSDNTIKLMDSAIDKVTDNAVTIGFTRTKSADSIENTIVFNFDNNPAVCPIIDVTAMSHFALANDNTWTFVLQPKALVNVIVTDDVADYEVTPT